MSLGDLLIWLGMVFLAWVQGWTNSCWFPFLLSANWFIRIPNRMLRGVLLFGASGWDRKAKVAPGDRDKMSLTGAVTYLTLGLDILGITVLRLLLTVCPLSPIMEARLYGIYMALGKGYLPLSLGAFLLGCLDYFIGKRDYFIKK